MATLPLKTSRNEQLSVIRLFVFCGQKDLVQMPIKPTIQPRLGHQWLSCFWANEENARWAEICIWYWSAINCSSLA